MKYKKKKDILIGYIPCAVKGPNYQFPEKIGICRLPKKHKGKHAFV